MPAPQAVLDLVQRYEFNRPVDRKGQKNGILMIRWNNNLAFLWRAYLADACIHH